MDSPAILRWFGLGPSQPVQDPKPFWLTDRVLACVYGASCGCAGRARWCLRTAQPEPEPWLAPLSQQPLF